MRRLLARLLACLAALVSLHVLAAASGCAPTDVIARSRAASCAGPGDCDAGGTDAGAGPGACPARVCEALDAPALACAPLASGQAPAALVVTGDGCSRDDSAEPAHRYAFCSCTDFVSEAPLSVLASDGAEPARASVGINGNLRSTAAVTIDGALQLRGMLELGANAPLTLNGSQLELAVDACDCGQARLLDVAALVAAHDTDDSALASGFDAARLEDVTSDTTLVLECGRYRVARIAGATDLRVQVRGHVALLVEGDVALDASVELTLDEGAALDLFVAGNVRVAGRLSLGGEAEAGRVRVYVGGTGTIDLDAEASIAGLLYAPRAELVSRGPLEAYGPLFVRRAAPGDALSIVVTPRSLEVGTCD